jgi:aspartate 1-decarboxylase
MEAADILPYEQVDVLNVNNGARFTTYAIEDEKAGICINGAAARLAIKGDIVLILTYSPVEEDEAPNFLPKLVSVDEKNAIIEIKNEVSTTIV